MAKAEVNAYQPESNTVEVTLRTQQQHALDARMGRYSIIFVIDVASARDLCRQLAYLLNLQLLPREE